MSNSFGNIKRIKIFDKLFVSISNNKFIMKDFGTPDEHQTIVFRDNGIIDVHKTKEGPNKKYESKGKFDVQKSALKMILNPKPMHAAFLELINNLKEVNFEEKEYEHLSVFPITKEELTSVIIRKKRSLEIPIEKAENFQFHKRAIPWKDVKGKINGDALVYDKDVVPIGYIMKKGNKFFYMSYKMVENPAILNFIYQMTHPEKVSS